MKSGKALTPLPAPPAPPAKPREKRGRDELAFLPAALEIVETPPSPIGRAISITIVTVFALGLAWACIGQVDIVATATGKIVPSGRTKTIQPFEIGIVRAIDVQDGQAVKEGDTLIELDPTINDADREHTQSDLAAAQLDVARLRALTAPGDDPLAAFVPPADAPEGLVATAREQLINQDAEQRAKLAALDRQRTQKEAERDSLIAAEAKLQATIPIMQQRVDIRKYLSDREYGSKLTYLETLTDLVQQQKDLAVQQSHVRESDAALTVIVQTRAQTEAEYRRTRLGELSTAEAKAAGLVQDSIKAVERSNLRLLKAPVDGVVQQLAIHTVGGVVTPAQALLEVVPRDSHLEIEAVVSNHDIGFIHAGEDAEIKVDTFSFTKYGVLHGTVLNLSADSISTDRGNGNAASGGQAQPQNEPASQELVYAARVSLEASSMDIEGKDVRLSPGMSVTVEIKTGSRRVISYLLSPLLRFRQESLRER
jgi:hemolysin D